MSNLDKYAKKSMSIGITKAKVVDTKTIVVANWVRLKCQYGCSGYGKRLTCPPFSPMPEYTKRMLSEYSKALLMQITGIRLGKEHRMSRKLKNIVAALEREIFLDGFYKAFGLASGPCRFCRTCNTRKECIHTEQARPAMEACGIDVYQTVRNNGFELEVVKTEDACCSYNAVILIE